MSESKINWGDHFTVNNAEEIVRIITGSDEDIISQLSATKKKNVKTPDGLESIDYEYVPVGNLVNHFSRVIGSVSRNPVEQLNELQPFFGTRLWRCEKTGRFYMNAPTSIKSYDESQMVFPVDFKDPSTIKGIDDSLALMIDSKAVYQLKTPYGGKHEVTIISEDPANFQEIFRSGYCVETEGGSECGVLVFHRDSDSLFCNGRKIETVDPDTADFSKVKIGILRTGEKEMELVN